MEEYDEIEPKPLPRWVTMPLGIILTPFTFLCVIGSSIMLLAPNVPPNAFTVLLGSLFWAGSCWVFYLSLRLLFVNPKSKSGLITAMGLRGIALVFAVIPVASLITGSFWDKPIIHSIMTVLYMFIIAHLWGLAKHRSQ